MYISKESKILVVDDNEFNIHLLTSILQGKYSLNVAMNGKEALKIAQKDKPDIILLDVMMPEMDGYEVCQQLKSDQSTKDIPVIFLTALSEESDEMKGLDLGAVDYIVKPVNPKLVEKRINNHLALKYHRDNLELMVAERTRMLNLTQDVTIESLGNLAEYRDQETGGHIKRTKNYVKSLAFNIKDNPRFKSILTNDYIDLLVKSAPLHDIGKVGVPDSILLKAGRLTEPEFEEMKKHTIYGRDIIAASEKSLGEESFLTLAREIAYTHHEKWDGSGYPEGTRCDMIPLSGRIMAIADVYDALISKRVYKSPFSHSKAVEIITNGKGTHFDPDIAGAFIEHENEFRLIALKYADFDEERAMLSI
ncbi:MAG: response regulator [Desulfamplus sp.]|nr:response regulator [Desulfamplus sp.]MBF0413677.1 response regulator [Desulfamplus sp.]